MQGAGGASQRPGALRLLRRTKLQACVSPQANVGYTCLPPLKVLVGVDLPEICQRHLHKALLVLLDQGMGSYYFVAAWVGAMKPFSEIRLCALNSLVCTASRELKAYEH